MKYLSLLLLCCCLSSCAALKKLGKKKTPVEPVAEIPEQASRVGSVALIHPDYGFVLIQTSKGASLPEGTELRCIGPSGTETAKLKSTAARQGNYLTADIASGTPQKDDQVIYDPAGTFTAQPAAPNPFPEAPAPPPGFPTPPPLPNSPSISTSPAPLAPASDSLLPPSAPPLPDSELRPVPTIPLGQ